MKYLIQLSKLVFLSFFTCSCGAIDLWVAPAGNDNNLGTEKKPLATIEAALKKDPHAHIYVTSGTYTLSKPLILNQKNTGAIIEGIGLVPATFSGATKLTEIEMMASGIWRIKAQSKVNRLWINGQPAEQSKIPAQAWHYITEYIPIKNTNDMSRRAFHPEPEDINILSKLETAKLANVVVEIWHSWEVSTHHIQLLDPYSKIIYLTHQPPRPFFFFGDVQRYRLINVPETTIHGTWYQLQDNTLYYQPHPNENIKNTEVLISNLPQLMEIKDTRDVTIRRLSFEFSNVGLDPTNYYQLSQAANKIDSAIILDNVRDVKLENLTLAHTGGYGIEFNRNCHNSLLQHSTLYDLGAGGVKIGETDILPAPAMATSGIIVDNNIIQAGGRLFPAGAGVLIGHSSNNKVTHNEISDFFYSGVSVGWKWGYGTSLATNNLIENNRIHHIGQGRLSDLGGIYTLGESPGTIVRGNVIHDINGYKYTDAGGYGLYADEGSSNILFERNLVYQTSDAGFLQHYGHANIVRNNVFAFGKNAQLQLAKAENHQSFSLLRNAILSDGAPFLKGQWSGANVTMVNNIYFDVSEKFMPWLGYALQGEWQRAQMSIIKHVNNVLNKFDWIRLIFKGEWQNAKTSMTKNMHFDVASKPFWDGLNLNNWQTLGFDQDSIVADPGFLDPENGDFQLQTDAEFSWNGPSPIKNAGVYGSEERPKLATKADWKPINDIPPSPKNFPNWVEDFDTTPVGATPQLARVVIEGKGDSIVISDEIAKSGINSLKFQDIDGLNVTPFNPYMFYRLSHHSGTISVEFDYQGDKKSCLTQEWRDSNSPYRVGLSVNFQDGMLWVDGKSLVSLPSNEWIAVKINAQLNGAANRDWQLQLTFRNGQSFSHSFQINDPEWHHLDWLGFISPCTSKSHFYIDNVKIQNDLSKI